MAKNQDCLWAFGHVLLWIWKKVIFGLRVKNDIWKLEFCLSMNKIEVVLKINYGYFGVKKVKIVFFCSSKFLTISRIELYAEFHNFIAKHIFWHLPPKKSEKISWPKPTSIRKWHITSPINSHETYYFSQKFTFLYYK